jgi:hypothetical protein
MMGRAPSSCNFVDLPDELAAFRLVGFHDCRANRFELGVVIAGVVAPEPQA